MRNTSAAGTIATDPTYRRPWPIPQRPWTMRHQWNDLLFIHWPITVETIRRHVPAGLEIDTYEGQAWMAVVPFWMSFQLRKLPSVPGLSNFAEINVRTYVSRDGMPGVWFLSLDASSRVVVAAARTCYRLPYFASRMSCDLKDDRVRFSSARRGHAKDHALFEACYRPVGSRSHSEPGSLVSWLTDRYCLYTADRRGRLFHAEIDHPTWSLQDAELTISRNTMLKSHGIATPRAKPLVHYSKRLDVLAWSLDAVPEHV